MTVTRSIAPLGLVLAGALALGGCEAQTGGGAGAAPLAAQPTGTVESTLRQQQLQAIQSGVNQGTQNAPVTSASPGVGGIERAPGGATGGSVAAGGVNAATVNPGVGGIQRQGVGAPETSVRRARPRPSTSSATPSSATTTAPAATSTR